MYNPSTSNSIKKEAYLQYFKYFSTNALQTIRRLQGNFQDQFSQDMLFDSHHMFKLIKNLLSSYEVLVLEMKDSCQFVQIPEFGICIVRVFYQLMSILKFLLKGIINKAPQERVQRDRRQQHQRHTVMVPGTEPSHQINQFCERQSLRVRENAVHIFKDLSQQVGTLERQNRMNIEESENTLERIYRGRQQLQAIESSQSQMILNQTVTLLYRRGQHINNFLNLLQSGNNKQIPQSFAAIKESFEEDYSKKMQLVKSKLNALFTHHIVQAENKRKEAMISEEIQVNAQDIEVDEMVRKRKTAHRKTNLQHTKKLRIQISSLEDEIQTLKQYMKQKFQQHDAEKYKLLADNIRLENRLAAFENRSQSQYSKGQADQKLSMSIIANSQSIKIIQPENANENKSHLSIDYENKTGSQLGWGKVSKVRIPKATKSRVKFQPALSTNSKLKLQSKQFEVNLFSSCMNTQGRPTHSKQVSKVSIAQNLNKRSSESEDIDKCQQLLKISSDCDHDTVLLKISSPLTLQGSLIDQWSDKQNIKYSQTGNIRIKKTQKRIYPPEQDIQQLYDPKAKNVKIKKQSILRLVQEMNDSKRASDFSQASCLKRDSSLGKGSNKDTDRGKQQQKQSRFYQQENSVQMQMASQVKEISFVNFSQIAIKTLKKPLSFVKSDLTYIFLSEQNAKNYELLNLSLSTKNYRTSTGGKSLKKMNTKPKLSQNQPLGQKDGIPLKEQAICLIGVMFEVLSVMKRQKTNYRVLCSFLRYPYSSIYHSDSKDWKMYQKKQENMQYMQLRKLLTRISKLHGECEEPLCVHWKYLLRKLGVQLQ